MMSDDGLLKVHEEHNCGNRSDCVVCSEVMSRGYIAIKVEEFSLSKAIHDDDEPVLIDFVE